MADTLKLRGRVVLNFSPKEMDAHKKAGHKFPNPVILEKGTYTVSDAEGRLNIHPALAEHWYVQAHVQKTEHAPAHVGGRMGENPDPTAAEAARLRLDPANSRAAAEEGQSAAEEGEGDGDDVKTVDQMSDKELANHVKLSGVKPPKNATREQLLALLPKPQDEAED